MGIAYFNGEFIPLESVRISPLDRGFLFGDSVYEVIPSYGGQLFLLREHLQRLQRSLDAIRLETPLSLDQWRAMLEELVRRNEGDEAADLGLYLQVTRGVAPRDHAFPASGAPTVFAMANPIAPLPDTIRQSGVAVVTGSDTRWARCDIKATTLLANVLARQDARDQDAVEAILLHDGQVTEGAASNVFALVDGTLVTPPLAPSLLPGVTRALVLRLAAQCGLQVMERALSESELRAADEIWLTSSTKEVLPVCRLDGQPVGLGTPGPAWKSVHAAYQQEKATARQSRAAVKGCA
ncbi:MULTISPECIES: D-amino acid aminotransferase [unclassified Thioalkalivibrio]|uniref:D-amino acid aminotransferase n=1 Tax=unclassified Thioalkalivibrio TaxID=2621013 RepID=UPI00037809DC|nr:MULTISPECIES: D-amino acid aminotransferase [unclassified Thioalkalivibrio]